VVLPDGDFVDLDWVDGPSDAPLLLVLHGLEGSSQSHYAVGLMRCAAARGWRALTLNFRSCSGELNRLPQFYHSGHTDDLDHVVGLLLARDADAPIGVVGVSLGGNVLLKWLGEREFDAPKQLVGAVAISAPFHLVPCARVLDGGLKKYVYTANFLAYMRDKVRRKAERDGDFAARVDLERALRARTFGEYDRAVTAPLHGFADEHDYWVRASSAPYLSRIRRPTLLISALDDPMVPPEALPDPSLLPSWVRAEFTRYGGHAGFIDGRPWRAASWAERRAVEFLAAVLAERRGVC
jgi:predicted alpha/beta-fold hydrolase